MEYNADLEHKSKSDLSKILVPEKLLKVADLSQTYTYLVRTAAMFESVHEIAESMKRTDDQTFEEQKSSINTLETITFIEFAVICAFGLYQYIRLKQVIETKTSQ